MSERLSHLFDLQAQAEEHGAFLAFRACPDTDEFVEAVFVRFVTFASDDALEWVGLEISLDGGTSLRVTAPAALFQRSLDDPVVLEGEAP